MIVCLMLAATVVPKQETPSADHSSLRPVARIFVPGASEHDVGTTCGEHADSEPAARTPRKPLSLFSNLWPTSHNHTYMRHSQNASLDQFADEGFNVQMMVDAGLDMNYDISAVHPKQTCAIRFATANVNTLYPNEVYEGGDASMFSCVPGQRVTHLERQFAIAECHVVSIQESRIQSSCRMDGEIFVMYSSAATNQGLYGCQIWIARNIASGVIAVNAISPRLMSLVLNIDEIVYIVINGHAPHEMARKHDKDHFWADFHHNLVSLRKQFPQAVTVGLCDLNAKVGSVTSMGIGSAGACQENDNGLRMRHLVDENDLAAVNTLVGAGATWHGSRGKKHRLDYALLDIDCFPSVCHCGPCEGIDLATAQRIDHVAVLLDVRSDKLPLTKRNDDSSLPKRCRRTTVDIEMLRDTKRLEAFQAKMAKVKLECDRVEVRTATDLDRKLQMWNEGLRLASLSAFGRTPPKPRKPWVSAHTWNILRWIAPLRRVLLTKHMQTRRYILNHLFRAWRNTAATAVTNAPCEFCVTVVNRVSFLYALDECRSFYAFQRLRTMSRSLLKHDRSTFLHAIAWNADSCMNYGNAKTSFALVKSLAGRRPRPLPSIKDSNGVVLKTPGAICKRWEEHFSKVLNAQILPFSDVHFPALAQNGSSPVVFKREEVARQMNNLAGGKGLGPNHNCAEIIRAAGATSVDFYHDLLNQIGQSHYVPVSMRGGRLLQAYKNKGSSLDADNYRGLLLADHETKILTGCIQNALSTCYHEYMPREQFGATKHRGTDFAAHLSSSFVQYCRLQNLSMFTLFVDLSRAFDMAIREFLIGFKQGFEGDRLKHLRSLGLSDSDALNLIAEIDVNGSFFNSFGIDPGITEIIKSLHTSNWFRFAESDSILVSDRGGRQGCKLGGIMFNMLYARALHKLREVLRDSNVVLNIQHDSAAAFWKRGESLPVAHEVVEATFVDDEALFLCSSSPALLNRSVNILLSSIIDIFGAFGFEINFKRGKTEGMFHYRGKKSRQASEKLLHTDPEGKVQKRHPLPKGVQGHEYLHIVDSYKHVGTIISKDGLFVLDARTRVQSAMAAYAPLANKVFSSSRISVELRIRLACSLVFSRLLYNTQIWVVSASACEHVRLINGTYMRVLRKIACCERFDASCEHNDLKVRQMLRMPSIECILRRRRLLYLCRLLRHGPESLQAILSVTSEEPCAQSMPWTSTIVADLKCIQLFYSAKLSGLGCPVARAREWCVFIKSYPHEWKAIVDGYHDVHDEFIVAKRRACDVPHAMRTFVCMTCVDKPAFSTAKQLAQHARARHGVRSFIDQFIDASGICPVCRQNCHSRLQVLAHCTEKRCRGKRKRAMCRDVLLSGVVRPISQEVLDAARETDRVLKTIAARSGHSHVLVRNYAKRQLPGREVDITAKRPCTESIRLPSTRLRSKTNPSTFKRMRVG